MSKSRSTTPTNTILLSPSRSSTPRPPTSRQQRHEIPPTEHSLPAGEHEEHSSVSHPTLLPRPTPPPTTTASRHTSPPPAAEMAKPLRRASPSPPIKHETRSSPSTDSQSGMADVEDSARSQHSDPPPPPPPKKKRTRTLTTPHQSAVLHALLAQSRFPTTAMREEVGRSIGLSARKVQIWFQNQRQKARRPRTTESTPTSRMPQYTQLSQSAEQPGPFVAGGLPLQARPATHHGHSYDDSRPFAMTGYPSDSSHYSSGSVESPSRLLGPGMPGSESLTAPTLFTRRVSPPESPVAGPSARPTPSTPHPDPYPTRHSSSPPRQFQWSRPASFQTVMDARERASRTLPPLIFPPPSSATQSDMIPPRSAPPSVLPFLHPRSPSPPAQVFAHGPAESSAVFPRPFTMQPPPQWDNSRFTSIASPTSWSRPSLSPTSPHRFTHSISEETQRDQNVIESSSRPGRYDPVRASMGRASSSSTPRPSSPRTDREQRRPHYD